MNTAPSFYTTQLPRDVTHIPRDMTQIAASDRVLYASDERASTSAGRRHQLDDHLVCSLSTDLLVSSAVMLTPPVL